LFLHDVFCFCTMFFVFARCFLFLHYVFCFCTMFFVFALSCCLFSPTPGCLAPAPPRALSSSAAALAVRSASGDWLQLGGPGPRSGSRAVGLWRTPPFKIWG
jgi:hypothetical protein